MPTKALSLDFTSDFGGVADVSDFRDVVAMLTPETARQELQARAAAVDSLIGFTAYTFPEFEAGQHHTAIGEALEAVERGDIRRLVITAPPRHTKSELASRRFPAWFMGRNPKAHIITACYGDELAGDFGKDVRDIVASREYRNVFSTRLASDSRAAGRWRTHEGGRYVATGVGGPLTGRGADILLIDDPIKGRADADSEAERERIWRWYGSTAYTRLQPGGAVILIATRWHEDDLIGRCLQQDHENWTHIDLPAIDDQGEALWPEWYPLEALEQIRSTLSPRDWAALYMGNPQPETGTYFQREWFRRYDEAPERMWTYISTDFGVSVDGDYTELAVWGVDADDNLYALDWWSGQATADVWIDALLDLVVKWKPFTVWNEAGVIRRSIEPFLAKRSRERNVYPHLEWITRTADKLAMAQGFRGRCSMGKVYFPQDPWAERVINQCVGFPAGKHDDAVDACALIGLALAEAWSPGRPPKRGVEMQRDFWADLFRRRRFEDKGWRIN
jgi:predicted phage terminase large subunit-like protein